MKFKKLIVIVLWFIPFLKITLAAEVPDPNLGSRASWMRGALGILFLPDNGYNGNIERVRIDRFLSQIKDLRTLDFVQLPLTNPSIYSPVHSGPHDLLEKLWGGDLDSTGNIINLVVPRASAEDPLRTWLVAVKAAGLRTQLYVNSFNLLARNPDGIPAAYPDISQRWMDWCDTSSEAQNFLNSLSYHTEGMTDSTNTRRHYMFCYAQFILRVYALRYGALIDAWIFDSASAIMSNEGDDPSSGVLEDQRIYQAFAEAARAGNPNAAVAFNNGTGTAAFPLKTPTLFDDYTFGHPFGGAGDMVETESLYDRNFGIAEYMGAKNGLPFTNDDRDWNDSVVAHFFPKQSTTSWNSGAVPCLTDSQFVAWNTTGLINGGAITWGTPLWFLNLANNNENLTLRDYALEQLRKTDSALQVSQYPGNPNWSRQHTVLPEIKNYEPYYHELVEGVDFWDPEGDEITALTALAGAPSWLKIEENPETAGTWILRGIPRLATDSLFTFELQATDAQGNTGGRGVTLRVNPGSNALTNPGGGVPLWAENPMAIQAETHQEFLLVLKRCTHFDDFDGDELTLAKVEGASWVTLQELGPDLWTLSGTPSTPGEYRLVLSLSDGTHTVNTLVKIQVDDTQFLPMQSTSPTGQASWYFSTENVATGEYLYNNQRVNFDWRALLYSQEAFQSDQGFRLSIHYTTGNVGAARGHNLSFGLISTDTDLSTYEGFNPFAVADSVYSLGINVTSLQGEALQGLNFTSAGSVANLDQSGTFAQFATDASTEVVLTIDTSGAWNYSIGGVEEASGILDDFDFTKSYRVAVYGQDDDGGGKSIQGISLWKNVEQATDSLEAPVGIFGARVRTLVEGIATSLRVHQGKVHVEVQDRATGEIRFYNLRGQPYEDRH